MFAVVEPPTKSDEWDASVDAHIIELTGRYCRDDPQIDKLLMDWHAVMGELEARHKQRDKPFLCPCGCGKRARGYP